MSDDFPYEDPPEDPKPCIYCGTEIDSEGRVVSTGTRHYTEQCREYVKAALNGERAESTALRARVAKLERERDGLAQAFEDLLLVADKDEDRDGYITAYHLKTGTLHRLLAKSRELAPGVDRRVDRVRPPCGLPAPFPGFSACLAPYGHRGCCDHLPPLEDRGALTARCARLVEALRTIDNRAGKAIRAIAQAALAESGEEKKT